MTVRHAIRRRTSSTAALPFSTITEKFLAAQEGRGNPPHTIKHYQLSIKKLQLFLCWLSDENNTYGSYAHTEFYRQIGNRVLLAHPQHAQNRILPICTVHSIHLLSVCLHYDIQSYKPIAPLENFAKRIFMCTQFNTICITILIIYVLQ